MLSLPLQPLPGWRRVVLLSLPLLAAGVVLGAVLLYAPERSGAAAALAEPQGTEPDALPPPPGLLVEVSGAVAHPGLYRMSKGERVFAAVAAAGGITAEADPGRLPDMAARLRDGQQIKVPALRSGGTRASRTAAVDLNSATVEELAALPGFSPELAAQAVLYRTQYGGFASSRELVTVLGMSEPDYLVARRFLRV